MASTAPWLKRLLSPAFTRGRRFARDERGVTAVEFGILAIPFFAIIAAIMETAMIFFAGQVLDSAVQDSSRLIRTGQAQSATPAYSPQQFKDAVCAGLLGLFDCTKLRINVGVIDDFSVATIGYPLKTDSDCTAALCDWTLSESYVPGSGGDVVMVQAYYKWPTVVRLLGLNFQSLPDGTRLLGSVRVFKSEPFACSDCS